MKIGALTDIGLVREKNEDYYSIIDFADAKTYAFVVADGMGGHNSGEVASRTAANAFGEYFRNIVADGGICYEEMHNILEEGISKANNAVVEEASKSEQYAGMGTTFISAVIYQQKLYFAHVGDSRLYLYRDGELTQITMDHSFIEELVKSGTITREEAKTHPKRNLITKALGESHEVSPDISELDLRPQDVLLLCTDGLSNMISDDEILTILEKNIELQEMCFEMIDSAKNNGGEDNVTVLLVKP